ncbi:MAG: hypothetical protein ACTFAL_03215 [Candidatus Electronema sp. V4]|uniref:hypothetical protein n=1 Tax=Candidatus Electronema sp. V4 TaxID=3454756 RepID=UPI0040558925
MKKLSVVTMSAIFVAVFAASPFAEDDGKQKVTEAQLRAAVSELQDQQQRTLDFLQEQIDRLTPVGAIMPWHKNLAATPELPKGWVECNGQILDDPESPYNGQAIPNLNGEGRFLRGSNTSGVEESDTLASHEHDVSLNSSTADAHAHTATVTTAAIENHGHNASVTVAGVGDHGHGASTSINVAGGHDHGYAGNHSHTIYGYSGASGDVDHVDNNPIGQNRHNSGDTASAGGHQHSWAGDHVHSASTSIYGGGGHGHGASAAIAGAGGHNHSAAATVAPAGNHGHAVNGKTAAEGDGETRPVNMSVVYIMKVKLTYVQ